MPTRVQELENNLAAKRANLKKIFDQAKSGDRWDFLKADAFAHLSVGQEGQARARITELDTELNTLQDELTQEKAIADTQAKLLRQIEASQQITEKHTHAGAQQPAQPQALMSLGQLLKKYWPHPHEAKSSKIKIDREFLEWDLRSVIDPLWEQKVMTTTAGWAPYATPIPRLAEFAARGLQVTDLFPTGATEMFQIPWYEETTRTNPAVETAENAAYLEATLATTLRTTPIVKIPVFINVTDEQMSDVPGLADYVDNRLRQFVRERLDLQLIMGDGIAPNMYGTVNTPNVQTQAKGADNTVDAVYKAMDKVRLGGRTEPGAVLIHPTNFQPVRLMKDTTGNYIWGSPSEMGPMRIWGVPILITDVITAGTAQTGDYVGHTQLWIRAGVEVLAGYIGDDFKFGRQAIRATIRAGLSVYRPGAICNITGL